MAEDYLHSVHVIKEACNGCVGCVKVCPTEAIRVRQGKAEIVATRCIDCGECIRRCPEHALVAKADALSGLQGYKYNVALATPSLYAQFNGNVPREAVWQGLKELGFDEIFDLSAASDYISAEIAQYLRHHAQGRKPLISSACPAVLRLIQVKFPELIKQVIPVLAPGEAAAVYKRSEVCQRMNLPREEVGIWFVTPCPAKGTNIHQSVDVKHSEVNGSISISSIFAQLSVAVAKIGDECKKQDKITTGSSYGIGWGAGGGEIKAAGITNALSVNGVREVYELLEQVSMNKMPDVDYVECYMCAGGCIGGPFAAENRFVAQKNLDKRIRRMQRLEPTDREEAMALNMNCPGFPTSEEYVKVLEPRPMMQLDDDITVAIKKLGEMEKVLTHLPGLDCGACGAPNCQSLAEDIVRGAAHETDCIFILKANVRKFAQGMIELATQIPLVNEHDDKNLAEKGSDKDETK